MIYPTDMLKHLRGGILYPKDFKTVHISNILYTVGRAKCYFIKYLFDQSMGSLAGPGMFLFPNLSSFSSLCFATFCTLRAFAIVINIIHRLMRQQIHDSSDIPRL